jgi:hypothetical protein
MRFKTYLVSLTSVDGRTWRCNVAANNKREVSKALNAYHSFRFKINWMKQEDIHTVIAKP